MDDNKREKEILDDIIDETEQAVEDAEMDASFEDDGQGHDIVLEVSDSDEIDTIFEEVSNAPGVSVSVAMGEDSIDTSVKKPAEKTNIKAENKQKEKRPDKNRKEKGISNWFKEIKAEFTKIVWPNKTELSKMTVTVIITSLLIGTLIAGLDIVFNFAVGMLIDLL